MIIDADNPPEHLANILADYGSWKPVSEAASHLKYIKGYLEKLAGDRYEKRLECFNTFLPPRLVAAAQEGRLIPFFGAGVSAGAGVPTWSFLLEQLGISKETITDPHLESDALTTAEILAHELGHNELQDALRRVIKSASRPTLIHYLVAQTSQPLYITTNYDNLFEMAWARVHSRKEPIVITNDADFTVHDIDPGNVRPANGRPILLKLHGCAYRDGEELILTRSQYRRHYRSNRTFFDVLKQLFGSRHVLFLGFSHRDPEISRQVEDAIFGYEERMAANRRPPVFYSLQFDMKEQTPEVFAARGIVALRPPISIDAPKDYDRRAAGLCKALVDLHGAMDSEAHKMLDLDAELKEFVGRISRALDLAMGKIKKTALEIERLGAGSDVDGELNALLNRQGSLAGQGLYLLRSNGDIRSCALPRGLGDPRREERKELASRFYVRQSRTFRREFVSDSDGSVFNGHSTFFLCCPLGGLDDYQGLLFAAAQPGSWKLPMSLAKRFLKRHPEGSFVLVDSNGIVLIPPNLEIKPRTYESASPNEDRRANVGFPFDTLRRISRRDRLVTAIWRNIVPLAQDDDVLFVPPDLRLYSVVAEVPPTRWKLALTVPFVGRTEDG